MLKISIFVILKYNEYYVLGDIMRKIRSYKLTLVRFIIIAFIFLLLMFDFKWRPMLLSSAKTQSRNYITRLVNTCIGEVLDSDKYDFAAMTSVINDEEMNVKSITADTVMLNRFKTEFLDDYAKNSTYEIQFSIKLGTLTGITYLNGLGPFIKFYSETSHVPQVDFISSFESCGINQTIHRIILKVSSDITIVFPGGCDYETVESEYILSETVIVGNVPNDYTYVIQNGVTDFETAETVKNFD